MLTRSGNAIKIKQTCTYNNNTMLKAFLRAAFSISNIWIIMESVKKML